MVEKDKNPIDFDIFDGIKTFPIEFNHFQSFNQLFDLLIDINVDLIKRSKIALI